MIAVKLSSAQTRGGLIFAAGAALSYRVVVAPLVKRWGATDEEVARPMPGDEFVPTPMFRGNHAITIAAPPEDIWPWLQQIGYGRAGFYSYQRLERMMGLTGIQNSDRIIPEYQHLKVGDLVPFGPGSNADLTVLALKPNRHLVLGTRDDKGAISWSFGLYPIDGRQTRVVSRNLAYMPDWTYGKILRSPSRWRTELPMKVFLNLGGLLMVRKMLLGIKARAERLQRQEVTEETVLALSSGCE